ncbi:Poly A polymerase, head domain [Fusarium agapanthi]|uniref:Poly A polymerase, head domain n=1 Tax=Fusarium agapanthi TaxID=1803897 RepID=A0A9P5EAP0_9HYPO|nr:Poly A polymerase, head domain [Fusarium agapanthi]
MKPPTGSEPWIWESSSSSLMAFIQPRRTSTSQKKLETPVGRVFGLDLDLVNLRKEVHDDNCRTPEMEFGTAEEDAFRRDATANALFFDLQNRKVADFTRRGLDGRSVCWHNADTTRAEAGLSRRSRAILFLDPQDRSLWNCLPVVALSSS